MHRHDTPLARRHPTPRTAIVTGASRGLGLELARGLAAEGWDLVIDARGADALAAARDELAATGAQVHAVPGDLTDPAHRAALAAAARATGRVDLLVHNAGILGPSPLPPLGEFPLDALRGLLESTLVAPLALTQELLGDLRAAGGAVLAVTSDAAVEAYPGWGGYGAAKAALEQACAVLAAEEPGLRVWAVDPGDLRTRMHQEAFPGEDISDRPPPSAAVPGFLHLLRLRPPSGRYRVSDLTPSQDFAVAGVPA
jgi:NAD(P)-dependent dehydrogenase (short-subunit alcohol dehydrogenase family)